MTLSVVYKRSDVAKINPNTSQLILQSYWIQRTVHNTASLATRLQSAPRQLSARKVTIKASVPVVEGGEFLIAWRHGEVATSAAHQFEAWSGLPRLKGHGILSSRRFILNSLLTPGAALSQCFNGRHTLDVPQGDHCASYRNEI